MRCLLAQATTGQDDDAGLDRTSERTTIFADTRPDDNDKTLDTAASCKEPSPLATTFLSVRSSNVTSERTAKLAKVNYWNEL
jgi:hypothetical protein